MVPRQSSFLDRSGIYLLLSLIVVLVPTSLWAEFISPMSQWDDWSNRSLPQGQQPPPTVGIPPVVRFEMGVFRAIVGPPEFLVSALLSRRTSYGRFALSGSGGHNFDPPAISALEWLRIGLPFWFLAVTGLSEGLLFIRRRIA